ncbi:NAD(P)/FAD-dependent oxidoreductase [Starkeya nomas]|uniref:NAD(P)/FAD-dependent oxidoreductase n=1 Tax=Starkeya nomas TaxID=2666134 RepID=UPI00190F5C7A|nr:FAD-dependent monooxygenase [Starkeya nomas]
MTPANGLAFDAVIVGARAAGASLALLLARAGWRVALIDRASFPSDTMSTHVIYPNTIARLDAFGVLDRVMAHRPPPLYTAWHHEGRMFVAPHQPIEGRDWAICVRRITLDAILLDQARAAGATVFENTQVDSLVGAGTMADPVRGVMATTPGGPITILGTVVVGADGVSSTVASLVGAKRTRVMPTETMLYFAYWTGAKGRNTQDFFFEAPWVCAHFPADDDHHVITMNGPIAERAGIRNLEEFYLQKIQSIPALRARLEGATKVSRVLGTTRLEGYYRQHTGPGWALIGDAAHFKHPAGAQGIWDAFESSRVLADGLIAGDWMTRYPHWRDRESREFYAFSKHLAEPPGNEGMRRTMDILIQDAGLARRMVDVWARTSRPWVDVIPFIEGMDTVAGASIEAVLAPYEATPLDAAASA